MTAIKKTEEQLENTDVFRTGADLVIEAGAGCGKTSQLVMLGQTPDAGRGVMIAFNKAVAEEANLWLSYLEAPLRLRGLPTISSRLEALDQPDAILCRTNADVVAQAMAAQQRDKKVAVVGGTQDISSFAAAVDDLRLNGKTRHPELSVFKTWFDVQSYVRDEQPGGNFATAVRLIETYGTKTVQEVAARCVDPRDADLVVSTVHKVKGLEWPRVQIDARLIPEQSDGQTADGSKDELRVAYVAVTRAQEVLDATAVEGYHGRRRARREAVAAPSA